MSDEPVAGHYMTRLTRGGPFVPVHIYLGQPVIDGEVQDRSPRWCVVVDGQTDMLEELPEGGKQRVPLDVYRYWPFCGRFPIQPHEYQFMLDKSRWAKAHAQDRPEASPHKAVDWNKSAPRF